MTKQTIAETILFRVSGGSFSQDGNVQIADILAYLPIVHADATRRMLYEDRAAQRGDAGVSGFVANKVQSLYHVMEAVPQKHDSGAFYIDLPHPVLDLPGTWPIGLVCPKGMFSKQYAKVANMAMLGSDPLLQEALQWTCWESVRDGELRRTRMWLYGSSVPLCEHTVQAYVSIENFDSDEPLPGGTAILNMVIDMAVQYFQAQRQIPTPGVSNEADANDNNAR